jgi:CRISPR system Cascade subunit CasD
MGDILVLRLDAPLLSFGAPTVDSLGKTAPHPSRSMLTGLLANALGWGYGRSDLEEMSKLQARLNWAARRDKAGEPMTEYQTVDLGQRHMWAIGGKSEEGFGAVSWTTRGAIEERAGATANATGTHQRWRDHYADAVYAVAVGLAPGDGPSVAELAAAVQRPARPLFLGRKSCPPAAPLFVAVVQAESVVAALLPSAVPNQACRRDRPGSKPAQAGQFASLWWPGDEDHPTGDRHFEEMSVTEERDWLNQIHVGERLIRHGRLQMTEAA